ncbi:MAG: tetratricopeptide repeat protein [Candidatus Cloacimonas sp.]
MKWIYTALFALFLICLYAAEPTVKEDGSSVMAETSSDTYTYKYITELVQEGDSPNLEKEIIMFKVTYPDSPYLPYVKYIEGNLAMERGDYSTAIYIFEPLLKVNLNQTVLADLILNYAYCLSELKMYDASLSLLQQLERKIGNPLYNDLADHLRGDIYFKQGQFYAAEESYTKAAKAFPTNEAIRYALYSTYLQLGKDEEALTLLKTQAAESDYFYNYARLWLEFLLSNERYADFDQFIMDNQLEEKTIPAEIIDICIRRYLQDSDYIKVAGLLPKVKQDSPRFQYYKALLHINSGKKQQADSLLAVLSTTPEKEIAIPALLEHLKLSYEINPAAAIEQLNSYLSQTSDEFMKAELYYTLGYFYYQSGNYIDAIKQLAQAKHYVITRELMSRIDYLTAEAFYAAGRIELAKAAFNRYLNLYPTGNRRDRAWFYLGYIDYLEKDYMAAKSLFQEFTELYPNSPLIQETIFYQAEIDFFLANYESSLQNYLYLYDRMPEKSFTALRIAQIYYYQDNYAKSEEFLQDLTLNYDVCLLKGNIMLARKDYSSALAQFLQAEQFASDTLHKEEALSYRALCLYQMKRFKEASDLYLQISGQKGSPETYLLLAAKSAFAAGDYNSAVELNSSFIEQYPESVHFWEALSDIANAYYNMGNYEKAIDDWINILAHFRNTVDFDDQQYNVIQDALNGLELALKKVNNENVYNEMLALPDSFYSEYIKFELNYILVKCYADKVQWNDLLATAEQIKAKFPPSKKEDIELIMATGLMELDQLVDADTLLSSIYQESGNREALLKWAELEFLVGNYDSALEKYRIAYDSNPDGEIWVKMLKCSEANEYQNFDELWKLGSAYLDDHPEVYLLRLRQLYSAECFEEARDLADYIINNSFADYDQSSAYLMIGMIDYSTKAYSSAIATLKRVMALSPEYKDIQSGAVYYLVLSLLDSGANIEAKAYFRQYETNLNEIDKKELNEIMEGKR